MHSSCHSSVHGHHHRSHGHRQHHADCCPPPMPPPQPGTSAPLVNTGAVVYYWPIAVCSECRYPVENCMCEDDAMGGEYVPFVRELLVTTTVPEAATIIGGEEAVAITLEFLADTSAESPKVTLTIDDGTGATSIEEKDFGTEYQTRSGYFDLMPGTKLQLNVIKCTARIRWIERVQ